MKQDCKWGCGPEVRGRRTLQELSVETPVWQYETGAHTDAELTATMLNDIPMWDRALMRDGATVVLPTDPRWG